MNQEKKEISTSDLLITVEQVYTMKYFSLENGLL